MSENETALNVHVPIEVKDLVDDTLARIHLSGNRGLKKKTLVAEVLRIYLPVYEAEQTKKPAAKPRRGR